VRALGEIDSAPELMAHHAEFAGEIEQAIDWWQKAGEAAFARPAYEESIGHLSSAIRLVQQMGDATSWANRELALQVQLAQALIAKRGYGVRSTAEAFERALALTDVVNENNLRFPVLYGAWVGHYIRGELEQALRRALRVRELAEAQQESAPRLVANRIVGASHWALGNLDEALRYLEIAQRHHEPNQNSALANRFGQAPGTAAHCYMGLVLWCLGYPDRAAEQADRAVSTAYETAHVNTICYTDAHIAIYALCCNDVDRALRHCESLAKLAGEHGMALWRSLGDVLFGGEDASQGNESGVHQYQRGFDSFTGSGSRLFIPFLAIRFASGLLTLDRIEEALGTIGGARQMMQSTSERWAEAELHRVEGDVYLRKSDETQARACYERAIETARDQNARSWELSATTSLAELLGEQGENQQGYDLLDGIYSWFSEGFESQDLKKAKSLLDQLS